MPGGHVGGWVEGEGPPVLLLHGGPGLSFDHMEPVAVELRPGWRVASYQQRGLAPSTEAGPFSVEREVVSVWAGTTGKLDDVPVDEVRRFESELHDYIARQHPGIFKVIAETGELSDDTVQSMEEAVTGFTQTFETKEGNLLVGNEEVDAMDRDDIEQEKVTRHVRKPPGASKMSG